MAYKKIGLFKGSKITEWVIDNIDHAEIDNEHDETGWLIHLKNGEWDAVVYDRIFADKELRNLNKLFHGEKDSLYILKDNISQNDFKIIIPIGNEDLLLAINKQIDSIKKMNIYDSLLAKYNID